MLTAQVEQDWPAFRDEVQPCLPLHWAELALDQDKVPLDPQWDVYQAYADAGMLFVVSLRDEGRIVGYYWGVIAPHLHYAGCSTLLTDIFWTHHDVRGRTAGLRLFRTVMREAKARGVQRMVVQSKLHRDSSRLFKALGFRAIETNFSKWIGN